ncbi:ATP-binding protein [Streptomyces sp. NPDC089919]|uniref:ATP-binding protein n=1 Tax=Streptomyces sp. NPDC089919 TaxID=3155188 RepID=UPI0034496505
MLSPFLPAPRVAGWAGPPPARTGPAPAPQPRAACSVTLPGEPRSGRPARAAVRAALCAQALDPLVPAAVQVTGELLAAACHLGPGREVHLALRCRDGELDLVVRDGGPPGDPRRRSLLRVLDAVVRECGGRWGSGAAREPGGGTRTWAVLPRPGAAAYGRP